MKQKYICIFYHLFNEMLDSIVAADALVLQHQGISICNADSV